MMISPFGVNGSHWEDMMKASTAIRRTGRGDAGPLFGLAVLLALPLLLGVPTVAYTSTHNPVAPVVAVAVLVAAGAGFWRHAVGEARRREEAQAAAAKARAEAEWAQFLDGFPAAARGVVARLYVDAERAAAFAEVGLAPAPIATGRGGDCGIWRTECGVAVRLLGIDAEAFARASVVLADALGVASVSVRRTRRRDGAYELHLTTY
ncbi:hypothetical protein [Nocardia sp. NPDC127526]|uniref:hypothetical protein n=1 Tax=Nocardia sp. NPDC127526 TaxID=3345393 RepID=UPI00362585DA